MVTVRVRGEESGLKSPRRGALTSVSARSVPKREQRRRPLGNRGASVFSSRGRPCQGVPIMAARSMIIPHAGSDETFCSLRKVAAARARGARRPSGAEEGVCGKLAEPQTARREPAPARAGGSREPGPEAHAQRATGGAACRCCRRPRSTLAPLGGEPSWGRVRLPHQQKRAADLRWSSSAHSECLMCGRARYNLKKAISRPQSRGGKTWVMDSRTRSRDTHR